MNQDEVWKVHPVHTKYEVSSHGRIRNKWTKRMLKPHLSRQGYLRIGIYTRRGCLKFFVHCLVLESFTGLRPDNKQANHKDGNKFHNYPSNLEWVTASENQQHALANGLRPMRTNFTVKLGQEHWGSKLTDENVREIKALIRTKEITLTTIARRFNVSLCTISDIKHHRGWKHIPDRVLPR